MTTLCFFGHSSETAKAREMGMVSLNSSLIVDYFHYFSKINKCSFYKRKAHSYREHVFSSTSKNECNISGRVAPKCFINNLQIGLGQLIVSHIVIISHSKAIQK